MYPMDEVDPYMPQEPPAWLLRKTLAKRKAEIVQSAGGALTDTVQAGQSNLPSAITDTLQVSQSKLPSAIARYRQMATDLYGQGSDLMDQEPDMEPMKAYAKQRGQQGNAAMLNALAAQYAGESFEPIQAQYLKRASASKDPLKMGSGYLTPEGQYLKDPEAAQSKKAEFLLNQAKAYETLAQNAQTAQERAEATRLQNEATNQLREMMMQSNAQMRQQGLNIQQQNAQTARERVEANNDLRLQGLDIQQQNALNAQEQAKANNEMRLQGLDIQRQGLAIRRDAAGAGGGVGGGVGVGTASQIGSGANNEPIFRQKNGQLFTYNASGQPIAYAGAVNPKASTSQPTEDERKAAGWFFQADNARRNMERVIKKNPQAAYPTVIERGVGFIPGVGEDFANTLRPDDRQQFVQAGSSMAEALLRAATGAGMNESEAKQKVRELVPQIGDKPGVVAQKTASYDVYMKSLQSRAGRALPAGTPGGAGAVVDFNTLPK